MKYSWFVLLFFLLACSSNHDQQTSPEVADSTSGLTVLYHDNQTVSEIRFSDSIGNQFIQKFDRDGKLIRNEYSKNNVVISYVYGDKYGSISRSGWVAKYDTITKYDSVAHVNFDQINQIGSLEFWDEKGRIKYKSTFDGDSLFEYYWDTLGKRLR
jgi:hypothetical protein